MSETVLCCVFHPDLKERDKRRPAANALAEAVSLADALKLEVLDALVVPVPKPRAGTLFGKGKVVELGQLIADKHIELVIIDGLLSPVQQRNLEEEWRVKILDRTGLILEIFGDRAATREGVLQVDLAHLTYQKSRLVRSWTHLERQRGAMGTVGGPGETQIESDRRAIDDAILRIKSQLTKVVKTRQLHRNARQKTPFPIVALVGYTNAGKSSIFNKLTGAKVLEKDMLFATLDPTMRSIELPSGREVILSDTVGFISELPTQLIAAFRATLEEVLDADLILHVRDISHIDTEAQADDVKDILQDLGVDQSRQDSICEVWNKIDLLSDEQRESVKNNAERSENISAISATSAKGLDTLIKMIENSLAEPSFQTAVNLTFAEGKQRSWLFENKLVEHEELSEIGYKIDVKWTKKEQQQFDRL